MTPAREDGLEEAAWEAMLFLWAKLAARRQVTLEATELLCSAEGKVAWCHEFRRAQVALRRRAPGSGQ